MDHHWVSTSWLSDVGLPQYSQTFQTHLVDGRVLNSLSRRDLERFLNIGDQYHQTSLLLAIQLLQMLSFNKEVRLWIKMYMRLDEKVFSTVVTHFLPSLREVLLHNTPLLSTVA